MSELGTFLKHYREEAGLTIEEISVRSKINPKHLIAIEAGDWDELPERVYVRAFIRHFAKTVGADPDVAIEIYETETEFLIDEPDPSVQPLSTTRETTPSWWENRLVHQWAVVALILIAVGLGMYGVRSLFTPIDRGDESFDSLSQVDAVASSALALLTDEEKIGALARDEGEKREFVNINEHGDDAFSVDEEERRDDPNRIIEASSSSDNISAVDGDGTPDAASDVAEDKAPVTLAVDVEEASWFEVRADGERIYVGILEAGSSIEWHARQKLTVTFGRPEGVYLTLNGEALGVAGTGVITREFTPTD